MKTREHESDQRLEAKCSPVCCWAEVQKKPISGYCQDDIRYKYDGGWTVSEQGYNTYLTKLRETYHLDRDSVVEVFASSPLIPRVLKIHTHLEGSLVYINLFSSQ